MDTIPQLRALAADIRSYQLSREWSDAKLAREIPHIGSSKTFKRILDPEDPLTEGLNLETQLKNYQAAATYAAALRAKDEPAETEYDTFTNIEETRAAVAEAFTTETNRRLVVIEGETGTGKDTCLRYLLKTWPRASVATEAHELWRDSVRNPSLNVVLGDILNALDVRRQAEEKGEALKPLTRPSQRLETIVDQLNRRKLILFINEAHHMGPGGLNIIKTLINRTLVVPVLLCIPKLMQRLVSGSFDEAIQLFGNRLSRRVQLPTPPADEIIYMLDQNHITFDTLDTQTRAAKVIAAESPMFGNWSFVRRVIKQSRNDKPLTLAQISESITQARSRCVAQPRAR